MKKTTACWGMFVRLRTAPRVVWMRCGVAHELTALRPEAVQGISDAVRTAATAASLAHPLQECEEFFFFFPPPSCPSVRCPWGRRENGANTQTGIVLETNITCK